MNRFRRIGSGISALLAVCLLFAAAAPTAAAAPEDHAQIPFGELEYERPDVDSLNRKIDRAWELINGKSSAEEVLNAHALIQSDFAVLSTLFTYATIRSDLDVNDEYFQQEAAFCNNSGNQLQNRVNALTDAILASDYYMEAARELWGEDVIVQYQWNKQLNSPAIENLLRQEQQLTSQYQRLYNQNDTADVNGTAMTLGDLQKTPMSFADYQKYYFEIAEKRNKGMGEIYRQLVAVRVQIAEVLGFGSYAEYAYATYERDYTPKDAAALAEQVKKTIAPLMRDARNEYSADAAAAQERSGITPAGGIPYLQEELKNGYPAGMSEALEYMLRLGMYDFAGGPAKLRSGYTTLMGTLWAPYTFINSSEYPFATTLFHEFGHYANFYLTEDYSQNLDLSEIHSQALELLMHRAYPQMYGNDAEILQIGNLLEVLSSVPEGCAEDEFQQRVFENPTMPLDEMNRLHAEIYRKYLGYEIYYEWVEIPHNFTNPFYYISYATSAISAIDLWRIDQQDHDKAMEIYGRLVTDNSGNYRSILASSGLGDPFSADFIAAMEQTLREGLGLSEELAA